MRHCFDGCADEVAGHLLKAETGWRISPSAASIHRIPLFFLLGRTAGLSLLLYLNNFFHVNMSHRFLLWLMTWFCRIEACGQFMALGLAMSFVFTLYISKRDRLCAEES